MMAPNLSRPQSASSSTSETRLYSSRPTSAQSYAVRLGDKRTPARPGSTSRRAKVKFSSEVAPHRRPGICASIFGFLVVFTGVMMLGVSSSARNQKRSIQIAGPICLTIGCIIVILGFTYQFIVHRRYKNSLEMKNQVPNSSRESVRNEEQVYYIETTSTKSSEKDSTVIIDNKAYSPSIEILPAQLVEETAI